MDVEESVALELPYDDPSASSPSDEKAPTPKLYRLQDSSVAILERLSKRKSEARAAKVAAVSLASGVLEDEAMADESRRINALLLKGPPISQLDTDKLFQYSAYYASPPEGIEWIDDETCILVFPDASLASTAFVSLLKHPESATSSAIESLEMMQCKAVPVIMWPVDQRLSKILGQGKGITGEILIRHALTTDVKERGARSKSSFYKRRRDEDAERNSWASDSNPNKRRRRGDGEDAEYGRGEDREEERKRKLAQLDAELDSFIGGDDSPPDKSSSSGNATIAPDGATNGPSLAERLGGVVSSRVYSERHDPDARPIAPLPRSRGGRDRQRVDGSANSRTPAGRSARKPVVDKDTLDAELEAFLNERAS